jgi:hypothetical protein
MVSYGQEYEKVFFKVMMHGEGIKASKKLD